MPKLTPVFVLKRKDRTGWWICWRDRHHRACEPDCRCRNKDGLHRVRAGETKRDAENMAQWVRDRLHPWNAPQRGIDWDYFVAQYMLSIASRSDAHRAIAERVITRFTEKVRPASSGSVQASQVDQYLAELVGVDGEPASVIERVKHWRYLHALFRFGLEPHRGYCSVNPVTLSSRPRLEESMVRAPRWADVLSLLHAVPRIACNDAQGLYLLVLLAVVTGLRANDLLALQVSDLELSGAENDVALWWGRNRKGKKVKVCGLPAKVEALVVKRIGDLPEGAKQFFLWPSFPHNAWDRLRKEAKADGLRFQALRRAGGALAAATGARRAGAQQLQHSSQAVYRRHYEDRELEAVAVAESLSIPSLPALPAFKLGATDRRGRLRAARHRDDCTDE